MNEGLKKTIASVACQKFRDFEFIVIDGASTDGSVETIQHNLPTINKWKSEKDSGRYNGMNKGIQMAAGDYLLFLNSGDCLSSEYVLLDLCHYGLEKPVYFGNLIVQDEENKNSWVVDFGDQVIDADFFLNYALPHQATLYQRSLFDKFGNYDENYLITGDQEFNMRLFKNEVAFVHLPVTVSVYDNNGISSNPKYSELIKREKGEMMDRNLGYPPIHFFTIVLNGMPYMRYHIEVMKKLPFKWHWHIIEGVADLTGDTAWSLTTGATIPEKMHKDGRSTDGTSEYMDKLKKEFPENISIYRKPLGDIWNGKLEMVNAPLAMINEETLLWEIDSDELWTYEQIICMRNMFKLYPDKLAAHFLTYVFVGKDIVLSNLNKYGNNPAQEWYRVWRIFPGTKWLAHEPPKLIRPGEELQPSDYESKHTFTHIETASAGLIFQHYAYGVSKQLLFKERYYGYKNAMAQWEKLQNVKKYPVYFKNYCEWVKDDTVVRKCEDFGITPIMKVDNEGSYSFNYGPAPLPLVGENMTFTLVEKMLARREYPISEVNNAPSGQSYTYTELKLFEKAHRLRLKIFPKESKIEKFIKKIVKIILRRK